MNTWLVKQEPEDFSWVDFVKVKKTAWTGVRNFQARNYLRQMKRQDHVYFYHSGKEKQIVGEAIVVRENYPDPTATEGDWTAVDLQALHALPVPVTLAQIQSDPILKQMALVRQTRLSVMPITPEQYNQIALLGSVKK